MKKQTVVIISVVVLLLLVVGCFGIYSYTENKKYSEYENAEIFSCKTSDIVEYSVNNGKQKYTLVKEDEVWNVKDNEVAVLDQKMVQNIVNTASLVVVQRMLSDKELATFEIDEVRSFEIVLADGTVFSLKFCGTKDETSAIRVNDGEEFFAVRKSVGDILLADLDKLRISLVFEQLSGTDEMPTFYSFTDYDKSRTVVRTKNAYEISRSKANRYIMEEPYKKEVDDESFEQLVAVKIPSLAAVSYVDDFPENLEDYGLDPESRAVLDFRWGDTEETLYLGTEEGGQVHAIKEGQDGVFVISTSQLEFLHTEPFFILESGILESDIENIYRMRVQTKDSVFDITSNNRNGMGKTFYVNGNAASEAAFDAAILKLGEIELLNELAAVPANTSDIVITVYYDNGSGVQNVSLAKLNDKEYAAFVNGKAEFAVSGETVDFMLEELNDISKNPMRTEDANS